MFQSPGAYCKVSIDNKGQFQKKKLMEFSIKGPDPASQPLNVKINKIKHGLKMLYSINFFF